MRVRVCVCACVGWWMRTGSSREDAENVAPLFVERFELEALIRLDCVSPPFIGMPAWRWWCVVAWCGGVGVSKCQTCRVSVCARGVYVL